MENEPQQKDLVVEARELLAALDRSKRTGHASRLLRQLADEIERLRGMLDPIVDCEKCDLCKDHDD